MIKQGKLSEQIDMLKEVANAHNLRLNRIKEYRRAVLFLYSLEIKLNRELNNLKIVKMSDKETIIFRHIAARITEIDEMLVKISNEIDLDNTVSQEIVLKAEANELLAVRVELNTILKLMNRPQKQLNIIKYITDGI